MRENSRSGAIARQHRWLVLSVAWSTIAFCFYPPPASAEKVVVSYPSRSLTSFLIPEIARQRGFFLAEGIEANLIYVRGAIDIKALVTGDVDYETIGSLNPGGLVDALLRQILLKNGLDPDRDVILINLGGTPERYAALKSGTVAATVLGAPHNFCAERDGFRKIAVAADYVHVPTSGLTVRSDRIVKQPQQIKKMIRGILRAMKFVRENRGDTIATIVRELGMDPESAGKGYEQIVSLMSEDGHVQPDGVQFLIDLARQAQKINKPLTAAQMIDHSLLEEVLAGK